MVTYQRILNLLLIITTLTLNGCDTSLQSNIKERDGGNIVGETRRYDKGVIEKLNLLGLYEVHLKRPEGELYKGKVYPKAYLHVFLSGIWVSQSGSSARNFIQVPKAFFIYSFKTEDTHSGKEVLNYVTKDLEVAYDAETLEIAMSGKGQSNASGVRNVGYFEAYGKITKKGFEMEQIFDHLGAFMPATFVRIEEPSKE